jgi:regulator of replication initiation timing
MENQVKDISSFIEKLIDELEKIWFLPLKEERLKKRLVERAILSRERKRRRVERFGGNSRNRDIQEYIGL